MSDEQKRVEAIARAIGGSLQEAKTLDQAMMAFFGPKPEQAAAYYVVTGIWRETGEREVINGFYSSREAMEEAFCHKHTHSKILISKIDDTAEAMADLIAGLAQ